MRRKHLIFAVAISLLLGSFVALIAVSQQKTLRQLENEMEAAWNNLYNPEYGAWPIYKSAFDKLEGKIKKFIEDHEKLQGIKLSPKLDWASALVDGVNKNLEAKHLSTSLRQQLSAIETLGNEVEFLWLDVQAAWYAYYDAVGAYNYAISPEERIGITEPTKLSPTAIFLCAGSCDALFETASLAQVSHQVYCPEKHGTSGTTGVTLYVCSGSCDRSDEHWRVCGGTCGNKYAPKKVHRQGNHYVWVANSPHHVTCSHESCVETYYTCEHSTCPNASNHISGGGTPPTGGTPSMHPCNVHNTTVSGDHSLQSSCSSSNANGTCTVTSFYACQSHTHVYPPPPPPTVRCGRSACTASVSSSTEHQSSPCAAGDTYYTCNPNVNVSQWENRHRVRTCRRSGCGNTWQLCQSSTPSCSAKSGKRCSAR